MSLPKFQINSVFNDKKHIEALLLPLVVITVVIFILILGFVLPKKNQKVGESEAKKNLKRITNSTTIKNAEGKSQEVPPEVLQITPPELKSMIDSKQNILIIQVNNSVDFSRELRIKGSIFIQKKNFDTSINNLTAETFNVFVSKEDSRLDKDSTILLNQIKTIDKSRIIKKISSLSSFLMNQVDMAIKISLALD